MGVHEKVNYVSKEVPCASEKDKAVYDSNEKDQYHMLRI